MKRIVLKRFTTTEGNYEIYLGNKTRHTFTAKRHLQAFINKTNKFLSQQAFELHTVYMDVWQEYQRAWFYFGHGDAYLFSMHTIQQAAIESELSECEKYLTLAIQRADWDNGNTFSFRNIITCGDCIKSSIKILIPLYKKRSQTAELYRMNALFSRIMSIENRINSYGQFEASQHITVTSKLSKHG